jgi:hypothetical protein
MDQDQQHPQHPHSLQLVIGQGSPPRTPREHRQAMLWRERMKLEFHMQGLIVRAATLVQEWQRLHGHKPAVGNEVSKIASRIVLAGYGRVLLCASEMQHSNQLDRIAQAEQRIEQDMLSCSMDIALLRGQMIRCDVELALL